MSVSRHSRHRDPTDRSCYEIEAIYAEDEHSGLIISEQFFIVATSEDVAKQFALDDSGRDESTVEEWRTVEEIHSTVPDYLDLGIIRFTSDEESELWDDCGRHEFPCAICGPVTNLKDDGSIDSERVNASGCPECGMPLPHRLLEKNQKPLKDGTQMLQKFFGARGDDR